MEVVYPLIKVRGKGNQGRPMVEHSILCGYCIISDVFAFSAALLDVWRCIWGRLGLSVATTWVSLFLLAKFSGIDGMDGCLGHHQGAVSVQVYGMKDSSQIAWCTGSLTC